MKPQFDLDARIEATSAWRIADTEYPSNGEEYKEELKQLLRDFLEAVKPPREKEIEYPEGFSEFPDSTSTESTLMGKAYNMAIDELEANARRYGL